MDIENFKVFMKKSGKPEHTINRYINSLITYENFLVTKMGITHPEKATLNDLKEFVKWGLDNRDNVYQDIWGIRMYSIFTQNGVMEMEATKWMAYVQNESRKLTEFPKINRGDIEKLASIGIITVNQFLAANGMKKDQEDLAEKSGASNETIAELLSLSILSQLPGIKKIRARLFYEAGLDTYSKIAALEPEEVQQAQREYIQKTGFKGSASTYSEAQSAVMMARYLVEHDG
jgi:hypothetical protein